MAHELSQAALWLDSTLNGDATLQGLVPGRFWIGAAPEIDLVTGEPPELPVGVFSFQGGGSRLDPASGRGPVRTNWQVRIISAGQNALSAQAALDRLDALLGEAQETLPATATAPEMLLTVRGRDPIQYPEITPDGDTYLHQGRFYEVVLAPYFEF